MKNENLYNYSIKTPWRFIAVVWLYAVGAVSFPTSIFEWIFPSGNAGEFFSLFLARAICSVVPLWLFFEIKINKIISVSGFFKGLAIIIPFLLVVINNFPIIPLITNDASIMVTENFTVDIICYALMCIGISLLEESVFRGLVFPSLLRYFSKKKQCLFLAVFLSSALFGATHIVNLLGGASVGAVVMQIGYSFLIGAMCAIAFLKTGNFWHAVLLHTIFDVGGLLSDKGLLRGVIWTPLNIAVTAVLSVIVIVYAVYLLFKNKDNKLLAKIYPPIENTPIESTPNENQSADSQPIQSRPLQNQTNETSSGETKTN